MNKMNHSSRYFFEIFNLTVLHLGFFLSCFFFQQKKRSVCGINRVYLISECSDYSTQGNMSAHKTKGKKRKSQGRRKYLYVLIVVYYIIDDVKDISTSHDIVAPYEICDNALGLLNFLVSGYLFDDQSFTSLYNKR
jgi:hypothetical protein